MKEGAVAGPMRVPRGQVFFTMTGKQEARIPKLEEVKERVQADAAREKAREASRQRAESLAAQFKSDFAAAAKSAGLEVKTTELDSRADRRSRRSVPARRSKPRRSRCRPAA